MVEAIAVQYVSQTGEVLRLIAYGVIILGAVIAAVVSRSEGAIRRAPYFAFSALLFLAGVAAQSVWLAALPAMTGGYLWVLMAVDLVGSAAIGYFFGILAMARSRDAFGHARYAVLAFIPLANFILLLKDSTNQVSAKRIPPIPLMSGGLGILSGFVFAVAGGALSVVLKMQSERMIERANMDAASQAAGIDFMIRSQGLEVTLAQMAAEVTVPQKIDKVTTLFEIQTDATTLRYLYIVDEQVVHLRDSFMQNLTRNMCANDAMRPILRAGGAIEQAYYGMDGREVGAVTITRDSCTK